MCVFCINLPQSLIEIIVVFFTIGRPNQFSINHTLQMCTACQPTHSTYHNALFLKKFVDTEFETGETFR